jgi:hypothetical protein
MSNIDRTPSFKIMSLLEARRSGLSSTIKNAGNLLVQDKTVPDSSEFVRFKKMVAVTKDRTGKKKYA